MINFKLIVIYEDECFLVIDKPVGLVVNSSLTAKDETLQEYIEQISDFSKVDPNSEFNLRKGIVHRLDKETSGVILIAKDEKTFNFLQNQFKSREVYKEYRALVYGEIKEKAFEINAPINRNIKNRTKYSVSDSGKEAMTVFYTINNVNKGNNAYTCLKALPKTGRTHQIRVHLSAIHHAVVGDTQYATKKQLESSSEDFNRMMLHAYKISILHPKDYKTREFTAKLPDVFQICHL
ncbi:MAG: hypothetical protein ACD_24C00213G0006 [uncultured bacterium]|uniref:Pseudouridine synthase n=1 Tax=candidate division WWE3 bacterium RBG_16_37_10 TaxID=1802610 RepID=A0A1F4V1K4_UNCKA|nr:MAG: hypothetical protein ACD_24C00213G0006 [uncultured bacterium]OGC51067.1 MAG: hypothetical protein A2W32_02395 [candidate division WWE3 bacterium RBG_16_37_10]